ncbi:MAG: histidinol dehydrogenase [bacterium]
MKKMNVAETVSTVLKEVRKRGIVSVLNFEKKFNGVSVSPAGLCLMPRDFSLAYRRLPEKARRSLTEISEKIYSFQRKVRSGYKNTTYVRNGLKIRHCFTPVEKAGIYVPSGRFLYPSSVLMNAIPAKVAGVKEIYVASSKISDALLAACHLSGVNALFRISGAQAVAAFAYGAGKIPKVDFIAGPGNRFVTEAKRQVFGEAGIDLLAGPSEIMILADESVKKEWIIIDLAAQLEHAPETKAYFITPSKRLFNFIRGVFGRRVSAFLIKDLKEQAAKIESIAPEHLLVMVKNVSRYRNRFGKCGAVFFGKYSAVAMGDYTAGPSHTLPTGGTASFASGLSAGTFLRSYAEISYDKRSFASDCGDAVFLADEEGMENHRKSIEIRRCHEKKKPGKKK